jgi:hypothetical protein
VVDRTATTLLSGVNSGRAHEVKNLPPERIEAELTALRNYAGRIDPKGRALIAHLIAYGEAALSWHKQPPRTPKDATALAGKLSAEAALAQDERQKLARSLVK